MFRWLRRLLQTGEFLSSGNEGYPAAHTLLDSGLVLLSAVGAVAELKIKTMASGQDFFRTCRLFFSAKEFCKHGFSVSTGKG